MSTATITPEYVYNCFDVITNYLQGNTKFQVSPEIPNEKYPLFVTWTTGPDKDLRGCIGTFSKNLALREGLRDFAISSAFKDTRFRPISVKELPALNCGVSLLVKFEQAKDCFDWEVGKHGIRIEFTKRGDRNQYDGVFLPEVMPEQGWDKETTLKHLVRKAGYDGPVNDELFELIRLERFQSVKMTKSYQDYVQNRPQ
uniref:AMMECR1 domain-containing protein n=1 Tax=Rhabditophanes sp. KR3021 TaxID=114890 RepID=A0AC35TYA2_9BILA